LIKREAEEGEKEKERESDLENRLRGGKIEGKPKKKTSRV
jgi:hypothetical protein